VPRRWKGERFDSTFYVDIISLTREVSRLVSKQSQSVLEHFVEGASGGNNKQG